MKKLNAGDPETCSLDLALSNLAQLKALFPEAVTEGAAGLSLNIDVLKALVGERVTSDAHEHFGLVWHGKRRARELALSPSAATLRPCPDESVDWDTTGNLLIEGDNLEVLKLLQKSHSAKVKLIYIDPPYNTGKDFVYPDSYRDSLSNYLSLTGQASKGRRRRGHVESNGRLHSDWLSMMYPRIKLARSLLTPDGVLCMSIDDAERKHAEAILDELFGRECFVGCIVRATGTTTGQDSGGLGQSFDYVLCYGREPELELGGLPLDESDERRFQGEDERGRYAVLQLRKTGSADRREDRPLMYYPVIAPDGTEVLPMGPGGYASRWRFGLERYRHNLERGMIEWKQVRRDGSLQWQPYVKYYLEGRTKRPSPLWDDLDGNKKATIEVRDLLGDKVFSHPKPTALIKRLMHLVLGSDSSSLVLDFFAGSGTTGHAVMAYNAAKGTSHRFLLVQLPEPLSLHKAEQKLAARLCDTLEKPRTLAELTKERLRRAGKMLSDLPASSAVDTGFRVFRLDSSNVNDGSTLP